MNYLDNFSNIELMSEIFFMQEYVEDIIENHKNYYHTGVCYFPNEIADMTAYLTDLEKEWILRSDELTIQRYNNVNPFLN